MNEILDWKERLNVLVESVLGVVIEPFWMDKVTVASEAQFPGGKLL